MDHPQALARNQGSVGLLKQHTIPACYLKAWLDPVTPTGQKGAIWRIPVANREPGEPYRRSPEKSFRLPERFTVHLKDGAKSYHVEQGLSQLENDYTQILKHIRRGEMLFSSSANKVGIIRCGDDRKIRTPVGVTLVSDLTYEFNQGKLVIISFDFPSETYLALREAFKSKYGAPDSLSKADYQNGFGARWSGEVALWTRGDTSLGLSEGAGNGPGQNAEQVGVSRFEAMGLKYRSREQEKNF